MSEREKQLEALLPCPFCGSHRIEEFLGGISASYEVCRECRSTGPRYGDPDKAIAAWNRRAKEVRLSGSFCIRADEGTLDVDYLDIDCALCGECEKPLKWDQYRTAYCCGYRYAYWTSIVTCHRVKIDIPAAAQGDKP